MEQAKQRPASTSWFNQNLAFDVLEDESSVAVSAEPLPDAGFSNIRFTQAEEPSPLLDGFVRMQQDIVMESPVSPTRQDAIHIGIAVVIGLAIGSTVFVSPIMPVFGAALLGIIFVVIDLSGWRSH